MKKLLAIFLAGLMLFGLGTAASAGAENGGSVNWDDFYIITQPQAVTVPHSSEFMLSVEVNVPEGAKVSYAWKTDRVGYVVATEVVGTEPTLRLSPGSFYPQASRPYYSVSRYYNCTITAVEEDEDGNPVGSPRSLISQEASVTVLAARDMNFQEKWGNFVAGIAIFVYVGIMQFFAILVAPISFIKDLFS